MTADKLARILYDANIEWHKEQGSTGVEYAKPWNEVRQFIRDAHIHAAQVAMDAIAKDKVRGERRQ